MEPKVGVNERVGLESPNESTLSVWAARIRAKSLVTNANRLVQL
jgi:hypothetical protein